MGIAIEKWFFTDVTVKTALGRVFGVLSRLDHVVVVYKLGTTIYA